MKKNTITLAIMAILFSLTNLSINAAPPDDTTYESTKLVVENHTGLPLILHLPQKGESIDFPSSNQPIEKDLQSSPIGKNDSWFTIEFKEPDNNAESSTNMPALKPQGLSLADLKAKALTVKFNWTSNPYEQIIELPKINADNVKIKIRFEYDKEKVLHLTFTPA